MTQATVPAPDPTPAFVQRWHVDRDDTVSVIRYDGGERRTLGIDGAGALAGLLAERAGRAAPPVVVLVLDVLHAELVEVQQMAAGRPIADWAPWLAAIDGVEQYPSAVIVGVPVQATCGGLELALAADIRIAAVDARLGLLETRMGLLPGAGGTQRLPELIGPGAAALLVLTGETVSGREAHRIGLVQLLADDPAASVTLAISLADRLAAIGPKVLGIAKGALAAARVRATGGFRTEGRGFLTLVGTDDARERMADWIAAQAAGHNPATDTGPLP